MVEDLLKKLRDGIVTLDIEGVKKTCEEIITSGVSPYKAVTEGMSKGMEIVGEKYESNEYFLAELIMAGETMKEGMKILQPYLKSDTIKSAGKVAIGTVRGDLHDIGKNVVVTLLNAANFTVIDLGVDVTAEKYVETVREEEPDILALSALLTVTMVEMEGIIKALENAGLRNKVKIIIGGAPITSEYAKQIGADAAARDAVDGVRICNKWMKTK